MNTTSDPSPGSANPREPLRIAVVGDSHAAIFHLEAAALQAGLTPIAAAVPGSTVPDRDAIPGCAFLTVDALLENSDAELVVVTGAPDDVMKHAHHVLQSGRHVVVDPAASVTSASVEALLEAGKSANCFCGIWRPHEADENWRQALQVATSTEAGAVRSLRFLLHDLAVCMLPGIAETVRQGQYAELTYGVLASTGAHHVTQLLTLVDESVVAVRGQLDFTRVQFGAASAGAASVRSSEEDTVDRGFLASIEFASGTTAVIDVSVSCATPLATGWVVQFERGGFANGQHSITVEDGEIYHVPVEAVPFDPYAELAASIRGWDSQAVQAETHAALRREVRVAKLIQLIRRSHETGQVIACDV